MALNGGNGEAPTLTSHEESVFQAFDKKHGGDISIDKLTDLMQAIGRPVGCVLGLVYFYK